MQRSSPTFFTSVDGEWFTGNDAARGPWSADACHAGPVTGLLARAVEQAVDDKQLARITADYIRPIPMTGFRIDTEIVRSGRAATNCRATLVDADGKVCATATSLHLATSEFDRLPTSSIDCPSREHAKPGQFVVEPAHHDHSFFGNWIEVAYPPGEDNSPGPTTVWMRAPQLLANEQPSPFQRACPLADCGIGISRIADLTVASFVNPDLTVVLHRLPESEWLASSAISFWEPTGIGLSQATLFDEKGPIGVASQTLLVQPAP
jgi:hypothetical protein